MGQKTVISILICTTYSSAKKLRDLNLKVIMGKYPYYVGAGHEALLPRRVADADPLGRLGADMDEQVVGLYE